ncbi:MAG: hypothetical protein ABI949_04970, partial [Ilumatobacteraceae bacterium]
QAVLKYEEAYHQCGLAPTGCKPEEFTALEGTTRPTMTQFVEGLVNEGLYFSRDVRGSYGVAESTTVESADAATAVFCIFDAGTVLGPLGPDGLPTVVNDQIQSIRYEYHVFLEGGDWLVGEVRQLERLGEGSSCPPAV